MACEKGRGLGWAARAVGGDASFAAMAAIFRNGK
jgi:hypothetical protein